MFLTDEGFALRDGQNLGIHCLMMHTTKSEASPRSAHYHKYNEFLFMLSGEMDTYVYDDKYTCRENEAIIIYANEPHAFYYTTDCRYIVIKFLSETLSVHQQTLAEFEYVYNMSNITGGRTRVISGIDELKTLSLDALTQFTQNDYANEFFVRADVIKICAHLLRFWHEHGDTVSLSNKVSKENLKIINTIIDYTVKECGNIKTHEAARLCGFSDGHFSRLFKNVLGVTFSEYAKTVKMNEAIRLLQCSNETVTTIAQNLGYASTSHFIDDFKKAKGISPKKYMTNSAYA